MNIVPKLKFEEESLEQSLLILFKSSKGKETEYILSGYAETRVRGFRVNLDSISEKTSLSESMSEVENRSSEPEGSDSLCTPGNRKRAPQGDHGTPRRGLLRSRND